MIHGGAAQAELSGRREVFGPATTCRETGRSSSASKYLPHAQSHDAWIAALLRKLRRFEGQAPPRSVPRDEYDAPMSEPHIYVLRASRRPRAGPRAGAARAGAGLRRGARNRDSLHLGETRPARPGPLRDGRDGLALAHLPPGW